MRLCQFGETCLWAKNSDTDLNKRGVLDLLVCSTAGDLQGGWPP